jgi:hypothetical protein
VNHLATLNAHDDRLCHGSREDDQGKWRHARGTRLTPMGPRPLLQNEEAIPAEMNPGDALILSVTRTMSEVATPQGT